MKIDIRKRALNTLIKVAEFVESKNTSGSGLRWMNKVEEKIESLAEAKVKAAFCHHASLAKYNFRCIAYNDWIIVYRISEIKFEVCRFIYAPSLP